MRDVTPVSQKSSYFRNSEATLTPAALECQGNGRHRHVPRPIEFAQYKLHHEGREEHEVGNGRDRSLLFERFVAFVRFMVRMAFRYQSGTLRSSQKLAPKQIGHFRSLAVFELAVLP